MFSIIANSLTALAALTLPLAGPVLAQEHVQSKIIQPTRTFRGAFPARWPTDVIGRILAQGLSKHGNQPVVVETHRFRLESVGLEQRGAGRT